MNDSPPAASPLPPGTRLGTNRIQREIGGSDLGTYYEVTVGSTMHTYRLLVLFSAPTLDAATLEGIVRPLTAILHPCLSKPFACGADEGRLWIRSELSQSIPFGSFPLPRTDRKTPWPVGERIEDAQRLRGVFQGLVPQITLWPLVADLLEGMACLHEAGATLGPLELESIVFQKGRHGKGVVAQWADYGLQPLHDPGGASRTTPRDDVRCAGNLFRSLLGGDGGTIPLTAWPEWQAFLERAEDDSGDAFPDGGAMYAAFSDILVAKGLTREPRKIPTEAPLSSTDPAAPAAKGRRKHEQRKRVGAHRRRKSESDSAHSASALPIGPAFKVLAMILLLCLVGVVAFWFASRDVRQRRAGLVGPSVRLLTEENVAAQDQAQSATVWTLSREALEERQANGDPEAAMRLAFWIARGDAETDADEARGTELARRACGQLEAEYRETVGDGDTRFWLGHALLTGLGVDPDPERGLALLEEAAKEHAHVRAMDLLGDYYASGSLDGDASVNDGLAIQWWRTAIDAFPVWDSHALEIANKAMAFIKAGRGLPRGDAATFVKWIETQAQRQHLPSILALGTILLEGRIVSMDEPRAMHWFRTAALGGSAEGMRRMAWMFERGIGTPQSDRTAQIWYRRAAVAGDPDAMERLALLIEEGRADEEASKEVVEGWRSKAAEARAAARQSAPSFTWWRAGQSPAEPASPAEEETAPPETALPTTPDPERPAEETPDHSAPPAHLPPVPAELIDPDSTSPLPLGSRDSRR